MDNLIEGYSFADDADHSKPAPDIFGASLDKHASVSVDTTMRFSPTVGLMTSTRCGDHRSDGDDISLQNAVKDTRRLAIAAAG